MTTAQLDTLKTISGNALDQAETVWEAVGDELVCKAAEFSGSLVENRAVSSQIPGYPIVDDGVPVVDNFITLVADIRDSTGHLLQAISSHTADVSQLQRVYYETSAFLPCLAQVISWHKGAVTEYLGDGLLALFRAEDPPKEAIYAAYHASMAALEAVTLVVNPVIRERYSLPNIDIGIGMAYSKAVVTLVGLAEFKQPNVFGACVWHAMKVAHRRNTIRIDKAMYFAWAKTEGGPVKFSKVVCNGGVEGYEIQTKKT